MLKDKTNNMPINVNDPEYVSAEKDYFEANTKEEKLTALRKMISHAPKHKGGENLRQQLTTRRKKLEQEIDKAKKSGKSSKVGIKKEEMQAAIIGFTNSGKSSILNLLTNAEPKISETDFTTTYSHIGMMPYHGTNMQLIEVPAINSDYFDKGVSNTADTLLIVIDEIAQIKKIEEFLPKASKGKKIIIFNKSDLLNENEKRKIEATLKSKYKKYPFMIFSTIKPHKDLIEELKEKIFSSFGKIRVYTKEPGKEKSPKPIVLNPGSEIKDVAEKILHGFSNQVKEIKIWGPSSKFPNQKVGLKHKLKDLDVVEFKTK